MSAEPELGDVRRCAVVGSPVAHSLSPVLHRAAYRTLGLAWEYSAHEVGAGHLAEFVRELGPQWRGLSLTMPLKQEALVLCDEVDELARRVRSVNTLVLERDGTRRGYNTDVGGMVDAVRTVRREPVERAVVLGAGATAASALAALRRLGGTEVVVLARSAARAEPLVGLGADLGLAVTLAAFEPGSVPEGVGLALSTVPAQAQTTGLAEACASRAGVVFDVAYDPVRTLLAGAAAAAGTTFVGGFELLLHQAVRQVELMTGRPGPVDAMRAAGEVAMAGR